VKQQQTAALQQATIHQYCKALRMLSVGSQFTKMAEEAVREKQSHMDYLETGTESYRFRRTIAKRKN
jgi:hypothetical protein